MHRACSEFLAGARRADDEHAAVGRCDAVDRLTQLRYGRGLSDQRRLRRCRLLELLDLAFEPRCFQRTVGDQHQAVGLERFFDKVVSTVLDGGDRRFDIAVAGDHDDRQFGVFLLDGRQQLQAVEFAALQPDVEKYQIRPTRDDRRQCIIAVAGRARDIALVLQDAGYEIADIGLIVDDQNFSGHTDTH